MAAKKDKKIRSLEPKPDEALGDLQESVLRARQGITVKEHGKLRTKAVDDKMYEQLLEMELHAFEQAGRMDELLEKADELALKTDNRKTQEIIRKLKRG